MPTGSAPERAAGILHRVTARLDHAAAFRYGVLATVREQAVTLRCETLLEGGDAFLEASKGVHPCGQAAHVSLQLSNVALQLTNVESELPDRHLDPTVARASLELQSLDPLFEGHPRSLDGFYRGAVLRPDLLEDHLIGRPGLLPWLLLGGPRASQSTPKVETAKVPSAAGLLTALLASTRRKACRTATQRTAD